jgi:hypothetical protein
VSGRRTKKNSSRVISIISCRGHAAFTPTKLLAVAKKIRIYMLWFIKIEQWIWQEFKTFGFVFFISC